MSSRTLDGLSDVYQVLCCLTAQLGLITSRHQLDSTCKGPGLHLMQLYRSAPVTVARQSHKPLRVEGSTWTVRPWNVSTSGVLDQSVNVIGLFSPSIMHPLRLGRPIPAEYSYH